MNDSLPEHKPIHFKGIAVSPGIAIAPIYPYQRAHLNVSERRVETVAVHEEIARFEQAVQRAEKDLNKIIAVAQDRVGQESAELFQAQILMLHDAVLHQEVIDCMQREQWNAEYAVRSVMKHHIVQLQSSDSEYFRERANDFLDIQNRLIRHLQQGTLLSKVDPQTIIVAENLTAADVVLFSRHDILGVVLCGSGATSHVSIMARSLGVPCIVGVRDLYQAPLRIGTAGILDGFTGEFILHPAPETLIQKEEKRQRYHQILQEQATLTTQAPVTQDGHAVTLRANIELRRELDALTMHGLEGIGLCRTEMLYLMSGRNLSEDEQMAAYTEILQAAHPHPATLRLVDFGGDKILPIAEPEANPFLGWRGLRILLDRPRLIREQIRAILRASIHGQARILLPMVTTLSEIEIFRNHLATIQAELQAEGIPFDAEIPVGMMVEVPSAALLAPHFAKTVDFFSIGTNDLTQYILAVDRGNDLVAEKYDELHPAVLMMLHQTIRAARRAGISVSICGEMASRSYVTPLLVGLGVDELSIAPAYVLPVKQVIRALHWPDAQALAEQALQTQTGQAVRDLLDAWHRAHDLGLLTLLHPPDDRN